MVNKSGATSAVLFDLDGTLADSLELIRHTYFEVFQAMGIPWGNDDVMRWIGRPLRAIADHFAGKAAADYFIKRYQYNYHRDHDLYTALFPGTLEMLQGLKEKGAKTGVVTSKGRPGTMRTVEFTGIAGYLDVIVTAHDVEKHKPLPDPVFKAMDLLLSKAGETIFIGDSHFDLEAGKSAGVRVLGVSWGICSVEELMVHEPEGILNCWDDLGLYVNF